MSCRLAILAIVTLLVGVGCGEPKNADDPSSFLHEEQTVRHNAPSSYGSNRTVRVGCDENGELHIATPPGAIVTVPQDQVYPSEAEIYMPDDPRNLPIRRVKSLGFIGDNKLGESQ